MNQEQLASINFKISNCDFKGAADEMLALAASLAESGDESLSDFLASYAYGLSRKKPDTNKASQKLRYEIQRGEERQATLGRELIEAFSEVYDYFLAFEEISILQYNVLQRPMFFGLENRENFPFIKSFANGTNSYITCENIYEIFKKQIIFYLNLGAYGERSLLNLGQRKTNIAKGKYWRFVELSRQAQQKINCLDSALELMEEQQKLDGNIIELKNKLFMNNESAHVSLSGFKNELDLFMAGLAVDVS